ncbi:hypothetical protein AJ79_06914 [Helicocarpus griseus UAMH5409]|uniref:Lysine-specific metallo-endopeptidase domain-containing protein n=1 Tax=Helicocarpus griseus UAMH5409 TaxID=1447875 RepID=A0A2B7X8I4_9EURO|nr:hypothetical protein AJ79_06914 [Helicocarpus griseus UAMH5409]
MLLLYKIAVILSLAFAQLVPFVGAYTIDSSCDQNIRGHIVKAVSSAMSMAATALKELDKKNEHIEELRDMLFAKSDIEQVKKVLKGILEWKVLEEQAAENKKKPGIYCHMKRLRELEYTVEGRKAFYDEVNKLHVFYSETHERCRDGRVVAFNHKVYSGNRFALNYVQLCPWFLASMGHSQYKTLSSLRKNSPVYDDWKPFRSPRPNELTADFLASRLDMVILHEFSHALVENPTKDWAYEWNLCVANGAKGCNNADSISYFTMGVELILKFERKLTKEGKVVPLSGESRRRPGSPSQGPSGKKPGPGESSGGKPGKKPGIKWAPDVKPPRPGGSSSGGRPGYSGYIPPPPRRPGLSRNPALMPPPPRPHQ